MIAAPAIVRVAGLRAVEQPALGELSVTIVPGRNRSPGIIAPPEDHARVLAVEIGNAGEKPVRSIGVTISPAPEKLLGRRVAAWITRRVIRRGGQCGAGAPVEYRKIFGALDDAPLHRRDHRPVG